MVFRPRRGLVVAVTHSMSTLFLRGQLSYLRQQGFDLTLLSSSGDEARKTAEQEAIRAVEIQMSRTISPFQDLQSLARILTFLLSHRPAMVNAGTPKAGLLVLFSAWLTRVPIRIYTMRGLRLETARGIQYFLLRAIEWLTCRMSTHII